MANNKRTFMAIVAGIWIRLLTIMIPFTFPSHLTTSLHRLRGVKVGRGTKINRTVQIDDSNPGLVEIGKEVWVTAGVMILCHQRDLKYYQVGKPVMDCPLKTAKVKIDDGAHIGIGAIIMPGVTIGKGAVIGAGAVVTRDIPPYCVAVGYPAKPIKSFTENLIG
jgi:acetyltransferase-like isoleucine patch superfamily enzyme